MFLYKLKVSIMGIPKLYRIIEISGNATFEELHYIIFEAFDREEEHLHSFYITRIDSKSYSYIRNAPEIVHVAFLEDAREWKGEEIAPTCEVEIDDAELDPKEVFHYLFDYGDEWWHRLRVESVKEVKSSEKIIRIVKSVGEAPPQYDLDEDDEYL